MALSFVLGVVTFLQILVICCYGDEQGPFCYFDKKSYEFVRSSSESSEMVMVTCVANDEQSLNLGVTISPDNELVTLQDEKLELNFQSDSNSKSTSKFIHLRISGLESAADSSSEDLTLTVVGKDPQNMSLSVTIHLIDVIPVRLSFVDSSLVLLQGAVCVPVRREGEPVSEEGTIIVTVTLGRPRGILSSQPRTLDQFSDGEEHDVCFSQDIQEGTYNASIEVTPAVVTLGATAAIKVTRKLIDLLPQLKELTANVTELQTKYEALQDSYNKLQGEYAMLNNSYSTLLASNKFSNLPTDNDDGTPVLSTTLPSQDNTKLDSSTTETSDFSGDHSTLNTNSDSTSTGTGDGSGAENVTDVTGTEDVTGAEGGAGAENGAASPTTGSKIYLDKHLGTIALLVFIALLAVLVLAYVGYYWREKIVSYGKQVIGGVSSSASSHGGGGGRGGRRGKNYKRLPTNLHDALHQD